MNEKNKRLTINEVAGKYAVSYSTVYNYCRTGKIRGAIQIVFDNKKKAWRIQEEEAERVFGTAANYAQNGTSRRIMFAIFVRGTRFLVRYGREARLEVRGAFLLEQNLPGGSGHIDPLIRMQRATLPSRKRQR